MNHGISIVSYRTIKRIVQKYKRLRVIVDLKRNSRRILSNEHLEYIDELIHNDRYIKACQIRSHLQSLYKIKVSESTITRAAFQMLWQKKPTRFE